MATWQKSVLTIAVTKVMKLITLQYENESNHNGLKIDFNLLIVLEENL